MTPADYVILFLCVASAVIGLWRGFTAEALSLLTLLVAIWLAWAFAGRVEPVLGHWVGAAPEVRTWAARVVVFVLALLAGGLISWLARKLIRHTGLSGLDRLLGAGFGLLRAGVLIGLAVLLMQFLGLENEPWWQEARLKPYADRAAAAVKYYAELGNRYWHDLQGRPAVPA
ncbi:MAG TPA: CvpA family protein [Gammaproteobacteria bacterium]|jgi:membrane protein required for colicin V production|nr:CvpA family protein [Gammaproteobacteria bacterium]